MNHTWMAVGMAIAVLWPILLFCLSLWRGGVATVRRCAPWAALPALVLSLFPASEFVMHLPWLLFGVQLGLTELTRVFLLFTALLWLLAARFAAGYLRDDPRLDRFNTFFLATWVGNLGLLIARDAASFYLGFALMTFAAYGLVVHARSAAAVRAGRVYIVLAVFGESCLLGGLLLAGATAQDWSITSMAAGVAASDHREWAMGLLLTGFGVKAGAIVLHVWLPLAHPVAPTPASAVLSGAMIKAGLLGWLQFLPLGLTSSVHYGSILIVAGVAAAILAVIIGLMQRDPKALLAYSSVSQMGYMTLAVGVALTSADLAPGVIMATAGYALHHAWAKGALFLGVGVAHTRVHRRVWLLVGLAVPALALAGAPLTSGAVVKYWLKTSFTDVAVAQAIEIALSVAAIGTTVLMTRFLWLIYAQMLRRSDDAVASISKESWAILAFAPLVLIWWVPRSFDLPVARFEWWSAFWPLLVGLLLAGLALRMRGRWRSWRIEPGDLLVLLQRGRRPAAGLAALAGALFLRAVRASAAGAAETRQRVERANIRLTSHGERVFLYGAGTWIFVLLTALVVAYAS